MYIYSYSYLFILNNDQGTGRKSPFNILSMVQILLVLSDKIKKQRDLHENDVYKDRYRQSNFHLK